MTPISALVFYAAALGFGLFCGACVAAAVPAVLAGQRTASRVWLLRAVGAGAMCLALASAARKLTGSY